MTSLMPIAVRLHPIGGKAWTAILLSGSIAELEGIKNRSPKSIEMGSDKTQGYD